MHDRFHIIANLNAAIDEVRRSEWRSAKAEGKGLLRELPAVTAFFKHRIASGRIESFNNQIAGLIHRACGMTYLKHLFLKMRAQSLQQIRAPSSTKS